MIELVVSAEAPPLEEMHTLSPGLFMSAPWTEYRRGLGSGIPYYMTWRLIGSGQLVGLAIFYIKKRRVAGFSFDHAMFDCSPLTVQPYLDQERAEIDCVEWLKSEHTGTIHFNSHGRLGSWTDAPGLAKGLIPDERIEFVVNPAERAVLLKRMRKGARAAANKASRLGLKVVEAVNQYDIEEFLTLHEFTLRHLNSKKDLALRLGDRERHSNAIAALVSSGDGRLLLARGSEGHVAGALFGVRGQTDAHYILNGSSETARSSGAVQLVLLSAMDIFSTEGVTEISLGGVPGHAAEPQSPDHGLYSFKQGLGSEIERRQGWLAPPSPAKGRIIAIAKAAKSRRVGSGQ